MMFIKILQKKKKTVTKVIPIQIQVKKIKIQKIQKIPKTIQTILKFKTINSSNPQLIKNKFISIQTLMQIKDY